MFGTQNSDFCSQFFFTPKTLVNVCGFTCYEKKIIVLKPYDASFTFYKSRMFHNM